MDSIDLNAMLQAKSDALDALIADGRAAVARISALADSVDAQVSKVGPIIDKLQAVLNEAVTVETDADGLIKSVHVKWPLA